jgi:hypothetical protein
MFHIYVLLSYSNYELPIVEWYFKNNTVLTIFIILFDLQLIFLPIIKAINEIR